MNTRTYIENFQNKIFSDLWSFKWSCYTYYTILLYIRRYLFVNTIPKKKNVRDKCRSWRNPVVAQNCALSNNVWYKISSVRSTILFLHVDKYRRCNRKCLYWCFAFSKLQIIQMLCTYIIIILLFKNIVYAIMCCRINVNTADFIGMYLVVYQKINIIVIYGVYASSHRCAGYNSRSSSPCRYALNCGRNVSLYIIIILYCTGVRRLNVWVFTFHSPFLD